jgi:hypothetical protein
MIVVNRLMDQLTEISVDYNNGVISKQEKDIKLDLLINQLELVEVNLYQQPLDELPTRVKDSYRQLMFRTRYKSIEAIKQLKEANGKVSYNASLRQVLGNRMYFKSLYRTVRVNTQAYISRNQLQYYSLNMEVFVIREGESNE